jgi:hypothetical protein
MAENDLDFKRDIAPLAGTYGLNAPQADYSGMTGPQSSYVRAKGQQVLAPQLELLGKLNSEFRRNRSADLAYERGQFEFEERKRQVAKDREHEKAASELVGPLEQAMVDPSTTLDEKKSIVFAAADQNTRLKDPTLTASLNNQFKRLADLDNTRKEKLLRKKQKQSRKDQLRRENDTTGFEFQVAQLGMSQEQQDEMAERFQREDSQGGASITGKEQAILSLGKTMSERKATTAEAELQKQILDQREEDRVYEADQTALYEDDVFKIDQDKLKRKGNAVNDYQDAFDRLEKQEQGFSASDREKQGRANLNAQIGVVEAAEMDVFGEILVPLDKDGNIDRKNAKPLAWRMRRVNDAIQEEYSEQDEKRKSLLARRMADNIKNRPSRRNPLIPDTRVNADQTGTPTPTPTTPTPTVAPAPPAHRENPFNR